VLVQAGCLGWFGADDGCACLDEFGDLAQHGRIDVVPLREHEQFIAHAVGERDAPVANGHSLENDLGVGDVVVEAVTERRIDVFWRDEVVALVAVVVTDVRDEEPLLQQERATRQIIDERFRHRPPDEPGG